MTALYRHYDAFGKLLYVGISTRPTYRLGQHEAGSHWSDDIATVTVDRFATREEAEAAETAAIHLERPLHNKTHRVPDGIKGEVVAFTNALTCDAICERLGVTYHAVRNARDRGLLPALWYRELRDMAGEEGIDCPMHLFRWKGAKEVEA